MSFLLQHLYSLLLNKIERIKIIIGFIMHLTFSSQSFLFCSCHAINYQSIISVNSVLHTPTFLLDFTMTGRFSTSFFFTILFIYFQRKGKGGERERNISVWLPLMWPPLGTWPATQACALTGNLTGNPLVCSPRSIH